MQVVLINLLLPYLPKPSGPLKAPKPGLKPKGENVRGDRLMGENGSGETIGESGDTGTRLTAALGGGGLGDCGQQVRSQSNMHLPDSGMPPSQDSSASPCVVAAFIAGAIFGALTWMFCSTDAVKVWL